MQFVKENPELMQDVDRVSSHKLLRRRYLEQYNHVGATREEFELAIADLTSRSLIRVSEIVTDYGGVLRPGKPHPELQDRSGQSYGWYQGPLMAITDLGKRFLLYISDVDDPS